MEGHVAPYLKEVGLAGNLPVQGTYIIMLMCIYMRIELTIHVECTILFRVTTSFLTLRKQLRRH